MVLLVAARYIKHDTLIDLFLCTGIDVMAGLHHH